MIESPKATTTLVISVLEVSTAVTVSFCCRTSARTEHSRPFRVSTDVAGRPITSARDTSSISSARRLALRMTPSAVRRQRPSRAPSTIASSSPVSVPFPFTMIGSIP